MWLFQVFVIFWALLWIADAKAIDSPDVSEQRRHSVPLIDGQPILEFAEPTEMRKKESDTLNKIKGDPNDNSILNMDQVFLVDQEKYLKPSYLQKTTQNSHQVIKNIEQHQEIKSDKRTNICKFPKTKKITPETKESLLQDLNGRNVIGPNNELRSMFGPNFVFNPFASSESKFQECQTSKNESGVCRYVQHCFLPNIVSSLQQFMNNVCIIENRYIGVCCPNFPIQSVSIKWQDNQETFGDHIETPDECGVGTNPRIVGGSDADIKAWPWMVALMNNKKFFCGGALINDRYVLTAAHCTFGVKKNEIIARVGEFDLSHDQGDDYRVVEIKRHGQYNRFTLRNDVALLKLEKPVAFNEFTKTVCFPDQTKNYTGKTATLAGWGRLQGGVMPFSSNVLQEVEFPIVTNEECAHTHGLPIPDSMICTSAPSKDKSACNGDSGGPLMLLDEENRWKVIGIVSWGRRGCNTNFPSVFTRVTYYLDWIKQHAA